MQDILQFFLVFLQFQLKNTGDRVAIAVSPEEEDYDLDLHVDIYGNVIGNISIPPQNYFRLNIYGDVEGDIKFGDIQFADTTADTKTPENQVGIVLQPGNSLVKHFVLKTTKWLFFPPVNHTFQIQVRYEFDDKLHIDTLPFTINIKAPMRSSIIGAIIGSFFGYMFNN